MDGGGANGPGIDDSSAGATPVLSVGIKMLESGGIRAENAPYAGSVFSLWGQGGLGNTFNPQGSGIYGAGSGGAAVASGTAASRSSFLFGGSGGAASGNAAAVSGDCQRGGAGSGGAAGANTLTSSHSCPQSHGLQQGHVELS
jgi:hypothetical protein